MAFREVTMLEIKEVLRRWLGGEAKKRIARQLAVGRNTVRHYIEVAEEQGISAEAGVEALTDERLAAILAAIKTGPERAHGEACEAAWAFFRGVFGVLIPDNTKSIVQKADPLEPLFTPAFLEYSQARNFVIDPTRVRNPKDKGRVERAVQPTRDDCFAGERLRSIEDARRRGVQWCLAEYGMRRHSVTRRLPLEHFEADEKAQLKPAPTEPYEVPLWCDPKVHRDQHAQVAQALYSLPRHLLGKRLRARADRSTVRFYDKGILVKTHARQPPGGRSTDTADFPPEQLAYAKRDVAFLQRQAAAHGASIGALAHRILDGPQPWAKMRRVFALLGLCRRHGDARVEETSARALAADMIDVHRLARMLQSGAPQPPTPPDPPRVIPLCRYLRPAKQYALPFADREREPEKKGDPS